MTDQPSVEEARANIRLDLTMCGPEDLDKLIAAVERRTLDKVRKAVRNVPAIAETNNPASNYQRNPVHVKRDILAALARIAEGG